jgi:hypothetical protein
MANRNELGADQRLYVGRFLKTSAQYLGLPFPQNAAPKPVIRCKPSWPPLCRPMQQPVRRRTPLEGWAVHSALCGERL